MNDSRNVNSNDQNQSGMRNQSGFKESNQSAIIDRQSCNLTILSSQITDNKEDDDLICPVCQNLIWEPIECSTCKLHVCLKCIQDWFRKGNSTCPISGCVDCFGEKPHPYFYKHLSSLKITCQNETNGCKVIVNYEQYQKHLEQECEYVLVVCPNEGCGEKILKIDLQDHDKVCEWRLNQCELCGESVVRSAMQKHLDLECQNVILQCPNCSDQNPNERCQEQFQRKLLNEHMKTCLFRSVECQHCHTKMTFQQLSSHEENCKYKICICIGCGASMYKSFIADHEAQCREIKGHCEKCGSTWVICEETHDEIKCLKVILEQSQQKGKDLIQDNLTLRDSFKTLQRRIQSSLQLCIPNNSFQERQFQQNKQIQQAYAKIFQILKDYQFILHQNQKKHGFFPKTAKEALQHFQFLESTAVLYKGWHSIHCGDCLKLVERIRPVIQPHLKIIADASFALTEINKAIAREGSQMQGE